MRKIGIRARAATVRARQDGSDLRRSGEDGAALNLQIQAFIVDTGGALALSLEELVGALSAWTG